MAEVIIKTERLTKKYKDITAVKDLDLEIRKGEIFGLVGPDGAGKTTTIQMLCTILDSTSGRVEVAGLDVKKNAEAIKEKIAYMSQIFSLFGNLTVEQNIDFFADLHYLSHKDKSTRKEKLFGFSRLGPFKNRIASQLSGGMKKKLALCCCLIHTPEILFLDEPTTGVDPVSRRDFWKILQEFLTEGITIIVSTPYMDEAERFDRVAMIYQGEMLLCDTPYNLKTRMKGDLLELRASPQRDALAILKSSKIVQEVQMFGESLHLRCRDFSDALKEELNRKLSDGGCRLDSLELIKPSLEDIFVSQIHSAENKNSKTDWQKSEDSPVHSNKHRKTATHSTEEEPYAIKTDSLVKNFGHFTAVNKISLQVKKGEIFGFLGPNGAGKSTLIRMFCGLLPPTAGRGVIAGCDMITHTRKIKPRIGYMSQKFSLYNDMTVRENVELFAGLYSVPKRKQKERMEWVLGMAGLTGRENRMTRELSGAWMQRLALGCAIIHEPEIVFLDEPTAGVDPISRRNFWDLIYELSVIKRVTVFVTTHYMDEAEFCNNLGFIYGGRLIVQGSPRELKADSITEKLLEIECHEPARALEILSAHPLLTRISLFGNKLHLLTDETEKSRTVIKDVLEKNQIEMAGITPTSLSLEDVFLALIEKEEARSAGAES